MNFTFFQAFYEERRNKDDLVETLPAYENLEIVHIIITDDTIYLGG